MCSCLTSIRGAPIEAKFDAAKCDIEFLKFEIALIAYLGLGLVLVVTAGAGFSADYRSHGAVARHIGHSKDKRNNTG